jgi:serine/threonine-protein kinase
VIFTSAENNSQYSSAEIVALSLKDRSRKTLVKGGTFARYVPPGFLVYARGDTMFAARFDPERLELTGPAVPILEEIRGASNYGSKQLTFSDNGTLLYLGGSGNSSDEQLIWTDREGRDQPASAHHLDFGSLDLSPDGNNVALEIVPPTEGRGDIWILEFARDSLTRLTVNEAWDVDAIWSADGQWITFSSTRDAAVPNLFRKRADGTGEAERLATLEHTQIPGDWSPDGTTLVFEEDSDQDDSNLMFYRPDSDPQMEPFLTTSFNEWAPSFSPDGRWIAFSSEMSGEPEIYVRSVGGSGQQIKISTGRGIKAVWNPTRNELIYRTREKLMSVTYTVTGDTFKPDLPKELFDFPIEPYSYWFDISADGEKILSFKKLLAAGAKGSNEPIVVINWIDELEAKVPR